MRKVVYDGRTFDAYYLYPYHKDIVKKYVFALKEHSSDRLFEFAARDLCQNLLPIFLPQAKYTLCFAPRKRLNVRKYGYDHAREISKHLSRLFPKSLQFSPILKRRGFSKEQKHLSDAAQRKANMSGKIKMKKLHSLPENRKILIFDDIITTGSTFCECAKALGKENVAGIFICGD